MRLPQTHLPQRKQEQRRGSQIRGSPLLQDTHRGSVQSQNTYLGPVVLVLFLPPLRGRVVALNALLKIRRKAGSENSFWGNRTHSGGREDSTQADLAEGPAATAPNCGASASSNTVPQLPPGPSLAPGPMEANRMDMVWALRELWCLFAPEDPNARGPIC